MTYLMKALILNTVLIVLLAGGFIYINSVEAESDRLLQVTLVDIDFSPFADAEIVVAQNKCGNETCTASQCCCLNIDSGAQCCRDKQDDNCVESCKKSKPC